MTSCCQQNTLADGRQQVPSADMSASVLTRDPWQARGDAGVEAPFVLWEAIVLWFGVNNFADIMTSAPVFC